MESTIHRLSRSAYAVIGPEGATNFTIIKGARGAAMLVDADIRRIDEVEEALRQTGCSEIEYLINTHEHFDHTSANYYFRSAAFQLLRAAAALTRCAIKDQRILNA